MKNSWDFFFHQLYFIYCITDNILTLCLLYLGILKSHHFPGRAFRALPSWKLKIRHVGGIYLLVCLNGLWPSTTSYVLFYSLTILAISGPQIIKHVNSDVFSVNPIPPTSSFTSLLFCWCAWSIEMDEKFCNVFATTKFPRKVTQSC